MKISYRKNSGNSYAVIEGLGGGSEDLFFTKMVTSNSIPNLLPLKTEKLNGQTLFLYDITGKQALDKTFESRKMSFDVFLSFMNSLKELSNSFSELLLDTERIILKTDAVFIDHSFNDFRFCADPYGDNCFKDDIRVFFDHLLTLIDYEDTRLVALVFSLSRLVRDDNLSLRDLFSINTGAISQSTTPDPTAPFTYEQVPAAKVQERSHASFMEKAKYYFKGKSFSEIYDAVNSGKIIKLIKETDLPVSLTSPETGTGLLPADRSDRESAATDYNEKLPADTDPDTFYTDDPSASFDTAEININDFPFHRLNGFDSASGIVILLDHFPFTIGKGTDSADFQLERPEISRTHCRIYSPAEDTFDLEDLNSKNGSYINGNSLDPYSRQPLLPGDTVTLADLKFIFI